MGTWLRSGPEEGHGQGSPDARHHRPDPAVPPGGRQPPAQLRGAARRLRGPGDRPARALVDIGLPGLDGYALAQAVRALPRGQEVLLVALTGYSQPEDRRQAREAGFDEHLV